MLTAFQFATHKNKVWLIGDSTMANKSVTAFPETGWGMPFSYFFDSSIVVDNRAKNGRSTKSFREEGLWLQVLDQLQEGDYVLIQFGHNDEGKEKVGRFTTPEEFKNNLVRYISETKIKRAIPILITPVARRKFSAEGNVLESHPVYADVVRNVASENKIMLIDLNELSKKLLQNFGPEASKLLYNHLAPGEHPNYPDGKIDDTHFSELGARKIAQMVLAEIMKLDIDLKNKIVKKPVSIK